MTKQTLKNLLTLVIVAIFLLMFLSILIGLAYYAIVNFSLSSVVGCALAAVIPGLIFYSGLSATIDFIKETYFNK